MTEQLYCPIWLVASARRAGCAERHCESLEAGRNVTSMTLHLQHGANPEARMNVSLVEFRDRPELEARVAEWIARVHAFEDGGLVGG